TASVCSQHRAERSQRRAHQHGAPLKQENTKRTVFGLVTRPATGRETQEEWDATRSATRSPPSAASPSQVPHSPQAPPLSHRQPPLHRTLTGTAWLSVSLAATGRSTPATATTVACSSPRPPGTHTAARSTHRTHTR